MAVFGEIDRRAISPLGIITEANPLNFPEGASLDEKNFTLDRTGSRIRRLGVDYTLAGERPFSTSTDALSLHLWPDAGEFSDKDYLVVKQSNQLVVHDLSSDSVPVVATISLLIGTNKIDSTVIGGDFVFTFGRGSIYKISGKDLTLTSFEIKIRDVWGIDDGLDTAEQPLDLTAEHAYNLTNQGWTLFAAREVRASGTDGAGPDRWPSNADVYAAGVNGEPGDQFFNERFYVRTPWGNTPAPRGSAIINPLSPANDRLVHVNNSAKFDIHGEKWPTSIASYADRTFRGASVVETYGGRLFYAGFGRADVRVNETYPDLNSFIMFSQTYQKPENLENCYQAADPADPEGAIVDTDGGFISIPALGKVLKMVDTGKSLLVFSTEGVWEISSGSSIFTPTEYQVRKITNIGAITRESIVEAADAVIYWSTYGIHSVSLSDVEQYYVAQNMIEQTIQTLYDEIPPASRRSAVGFFDSRGKKLRWLYSNTGSYVKDRELVYDIVLQAWTRNEIAVHSTGHGVVGYVGLPETLSNTITANVVASEDNVVASTDNVVAPDIEITSADREHLYLVHHEDDAVYGFADFRNVSFADWGETDAEAELLTGYMVGDTPSRRKSASYLTAHMERTETTLQDTGSSFGDTWDLANATFDNASLLIDGNELPGHINPATDPSGIYLKPDGTQLYVIERELDDVHQYNLTTPWDIATASYSGVSFTVRPESDFPEDVAFKDDGSKMYVLDGSTNLIYQYTLSTEWDISTATYDSVTSPNLFDQDSNPRGISFKTDGTKLYMVGSTNDSVFQYSLSVAWDISTLSYDGISLSVSTEDTGPGGVLLKPDGTKMFVIGASSDAVHQYGLSTPWDLSTASYDSVMFSVATEDTTPKALAFKPDGTVLYMSGFDTWSVYQYSVPTEAAASPSGPSTAYADGILVFGESSCLLQAQWDWTDNIVAGKWSQEIQLYRHVRFWMPEFEGDTAEFDDGYPVVTTKNRLRGSGRALSLRFKTEPQKHCKLLGWNLQLAQNQKV